MTLKVGRVARLGLGLARPVIAVCQFFPIARRQMVSIISTIYFGKKLESF
jgi:hypothetical protein